MGIKDKAYIHLISKTQHLCDPIRIPQMRARSSEKALINVRFTQEELDVLLGPIARR